MLALLSTVPQGGPSLQSVADGLPMVGFLLMEHQHQERGDREMTTKVYLYSSPLGSRNRRSNERWQ